MKGIISWKLQLLKINKEIEIIKLAIFEIDLMYYKHLPKRKAMDKWKNIRTDNSQKKKSEWFLILWKDAWF